MLCPISHRKIVKCLGNVNENHTGITENPTRPYTFLSTLVQLTQLGAAKVLHFACVLSEREKKRRKQEKHLICQILKHLLTAIACQKKMCIFHIITNQVKSLNAKIMF